MVTKMNLEIWLEWYPKKSDNLKGQECLKGWTLEDLRRFFEFENLDEEAILCVHIVDKSKASRLQPYVTHFFDFNKYDYYISPAAVDDN